MSATITTYGNVIRVEMNEYGASDTSIVKSIISTKSTPIQMGITPFPFDGDMKGLDMVYIDFIGAGHRNYIHFSMFDSSHGFASNDDVIAYFINFLNS